MALLKTGKEDSQPALELVSSLQDAVNAAGLKAQALSVGLAVKSANPPQLPRTAVVLGDGEKDATWMVASLRDLFRGSTVPPNLEKFPPEYVPYFHFIEQHVIGMCHSMGDRTDQQLEEVYSMLRRRPDGRSVGPEHDFVWQVCALMLGMYPLSQAQFEAIVGRLEHSARSFAMRPVSRNYAAHLHHQFGCG